MKAGQITAKLRDAVPVCFYQDGEEVIRYKNIEIPDSLKELEIMDFMFDVVPDGKITFRLCFDNGVLPEQFPEARIPTTRAAMAAAKASKAVQAEERAKAVIIEVAAEAIAAVADDGKVTVIPVAEDGSDSTPEMPAIPETRFNVTGERRKALVAAIGEYTGEAPIYKAAPTFAYVIGAYTVDKTGTLIGEPNPELLAALAEQGFQPVEADAE